MFEIACVVCGGARACARARVPVCLRACLRACLGAFVASACARCVRRARGVPDGPATANEGYLDTSLEQARRTGVARADRVTITVPAGVTVGTPATVEFPFMRGTRGSSFVSLYRASWHVDATEGTRVSIVLRSEKGGTDRRDVELARIR